MQVVLFSTVDQCRSDTSTEFHPQIPSRIFRRTSPCCDCSLCFSYSLPFRRIAPWMPTVSTAVAAKTTPVSVSTAGRTTIANASAIWSVTTAVFVASTCHTGDWKSNRTCIATVPAIPVSTKTPFAICVAPTIV